MLISCKTKSINISFLSKEENLVIPISSVLIPAIYGLCTKTFFSHLTLNKAIMPLERKGPHRVEENEKNWNNRGKDIKRNRFQSVRR